MKIRAFQAQDFERVQRIYQQGIATGNATFQLREKNWQQWQDSMLEKTCIVLINSDSSGKASEHYRVTMPGLILGWAGLSGISSREVYAGVAEVSVYVDSEYSGQGGGKKLLTHLITHSESLGYWTLQAAIFPENTASVRLHLNSGFECVGRRKALGKMQGKWRDVLLLERRSLTVGL